MNFKSLINEIIKSDFIILDEFKSEILTYNYLFNLNLNYK